jgi:hypothetical protein
MWQQKQQAAADGVLHFRARRRIDGFAANNRDLDNDARSGLVLAIFESLMGLCRAPS